MLFSEGYMETDYMFLQKKADKDIKGLEDLKGKTITVNKGSAYETWVKANGEKYGFKFDVYGTNADAGAGRAFPDAPTRTWRAIRSSLGGQAEPEVKATYTYKTGLVWAMPFRLDDKEGRAQVNMVLKCMKLDGTVARLHEKWFGIKPEKDSWVYKVAPGHGVPGMEGYDPTPVTPKCS
jgi:polar amino acid transport system substrate-binding protein